MDAFVRPLRRLMHSATDHDAGNRRRRAWRRSVQLGSAVLQLSPASVALEYACGAIGALDAYSSYLTSDQLNDVYSQIEGNFVGLGIELKAIGGALQIVKVITGSPAERAGLRAGDRIAEVDGKATADNDHRPGGRPVARPRRQRRQNRHGEPQ